MKPKVKSVFTLILVAVIIFSAVNVSYFALRFYLASEVPFVVVNGLSMQPTYYTGDLILVKGVENKSTIQVNDVIVYYQSSLNELVIHRVVTVIHVGNQVQFKTQGDNPLTNPLPDPWIVRESDLDGVVLYRIPYVGSVFEFMTSPAVRASTAVLLIILIVVNIFYDDEKPKKPEGKAPL